jgi:UDP-glucose 4-epimerase
MRVIVTGGAGFIGSHVVDALVAREHDILVFDNFRTGNQRNLTEALRSGRLEVCQADLLQQNAFEKVCGRFRPSVVIHLAALVSVEEARRSPENNFRLNVETTHRVICAAQIAKVSRVIFASSAAVYGNNPRIPLAETERPQPLSLYGAAKVASEVLLACSARDYGFDSVALRFFNVFGPRQRADSPYSGVISIFIDRVARGLPVMIFGDGQQTRDFVAVRDVAAAVVATAETPSNLNGVFNVCTGVQTTLLGLLGLIEGIVKHPIPVTFAPFRPDDIRNSCGNPGALLSTLGFHAETRMEDTIKELLENSGRTLRDQC